MYVSWGMIVLSVCRIKLKKKNANSLSKSS